MKKLLIAAVLLTGLSICAAAQKKAPEPVLKSFSGKFTGATSVKWDMESQNEWEAEFRLNGKEMSASFDPSGKWIETETEISKGELPSDVSATLDREYAGYKRGEMSIVENTRMKGYEIALKKGDSAIEVVIDATGKILKKETLGKDEDND